MSLATGKSKNTSEASVLTVSFKNNDAQQSKDLVQSHRHMWCTAQFQTLQELQMPAGSPIIGNQNSLGVQSMIDISKQHQIR